MNPAFTNFQKKVQNPVAYKAFMLGNLPAAFFCGLRIKEFNQEYAVVSVKQKWMNKNPFHSIYFAVLTMAAEMSTGLLCMGEIYKRKPAVSMLVTKVESEFVKKATGEILFTCRDGNSISKAVEAAINLKQPQTIFCTSNGLNERDEIIAKCHITWSFKAKN